MTLNISAHGLPNDDKNLAQGVQALYG